MPTDTDMPPQQAIEAAAQPEAPEAPPEQPDDLMADDLMVDDLADHGMATESTTASGPMADVGDDLPDILHDVSTMPAALPDTPVYKRPVIEVNVPGLDAPRALERDAMMKKLDELRQRGLAGADGDTGTR